MREPLRSLAAVAATVAVVGCEGGNVFPGVTELPERGAVREDVLGFWTGTEEISSTRARASLPPENLRFPVAVEFRDDRRFTLWSYRASSGSTGSPDRTCDGVFRTERTTLEFFPEEDCGSLPLHRFVVGRFAPQGLLLEGRSDSAVRDGSGEEASNLVVRIRVERD